jgi:hypothetical protein
VRSARKAYKIYGWILAKFIALYGESLADPRVALGNDKRVLDIVEAAWRKWPDADAWKILPGAVYGASLIRVGADYFPYAAIGKNLDPYTGGHVFSRPFATPTDVVQARKAGYYVARQHDEIAYTVIAVPKEQWAKWRSDVLVVTGYKQFAPEETTVIPPYARRGKEYKNKVFLGGTACSISSYHESGKLRGYRALSPSAGITIGSEIEINPSAPRETAASALLYDFGDWLDIERDGSVPSGFEIVTGYGSLEDLSARVRELYQKYLATRNHEFRASSATGLHFHVGSDKLTAKAIATLIYLLESCPNLTVTIAGRRPNRYCVFPRYRWAKDWYLHRMAGDEPFVFSDVRYTHVNVRVSSNAGAQRFEWRSPASTTSFANWRARAEFIVHATRYALHTAPQIEAGKRDAPSYDDFLQFMDTLPREQTVGIRRLLASSAAKRAAEAYDIKNPLPYNARSEYELLSV